jgi:triphosphatase
MSGHIEVEAKFLSPRRVAAASIESFLESLGLKVEWQEPQRQRDIYWDTFDGKLLQEGAALRVRCVDEKFTVTFKGPRASDGAVFARPEVEWQLTDQEADTFQQHDDWVPQLPPEVTPDFPVDPRTLERVLTVETLRHKAIVSNAEDFRAELALDNTTFKGSHSQAKHGEIELELKAGSSAQLERIAEALRQRFGLEPSARSKFQIGMASVGRSFNPWIKS